LEKAGDDAGVGRLDFGKLDGVGVVLEVCVLPVITGLEGTGNDGEGFCLPRLNHHANKNIKAAAMTAKVRYIRGFIYSMARDLE
jgi:hypothetical protein